MTISALKKYQHIRFELMVKPGVSHLCLQCCIQLSLYTHGVCSVTDVGNEVKLKNVI